MNKAEFIRNSINEFTSCMLQYIEEAEGQDGDEYWDKFQEPEEFFDDLIIYIRHMGPNVHMTRVLLIDSAGRTKQTYMVPQLEAEMVVSDWPEYCTYKDAEFMLFNKNTLKWDRVEEL